MYIYIIYNYMVLTSLKDKSILLSNTHFSSLIDMCTLLDRKNISSKTNGQVAARRVTDWAYYQKALLLCSLVSYS